MRPLPAAEDGGDGVYLLLREGRPVGDDPLRMSNHVRFSRSHTLCLTARLLPIAKR